MNGENLIQTIQWTEWTPRRELSPEFVRRDGKLAILTGGNTNVYGKWISKEIPAANSKAIAFEARFREQNIDNKEKSVFALLSLYDREHVMLERDYADIYAADGFGTLHKRMDIPEKTAFIVIELCVKWCADASVEWSDVTLDLYDEYPARSVKIATTFKNPYDTPGKNLEEIINIINKAGKENPDVILFSELVYESYTGIPLDEIAQPIPGILTGKIGEYAKKYNTYIIFTMNEKDGNLIYNTAVIIGRDGTVCGKYRKVHLPLSEAEAGTSPGNTHGIFDLDFGKIGIIICYDHMFPESSRTLSLMGAEIIFIPTMGEDEILQRAISRSNGIYTVVAGYSGSKSSRIINPYGEIINSVPDAETGYSASTFDLNERFLTYWMSIGPGNGESRVLFRKERMTETYGAIDKETYKLK